MYYSLFQEVVILFPYCVHDCDYPTILTTKLEFCWCVFYVTNFHTNQFMIEIVSFK